MQLKFTPGPWKALGYSIVKGSRRHTIADTYMQSGNSVALGVEVTKANVALIAAAPDMFDALEDVLEWCDVIEQNYPEMRFTKKVRAALKKAGAQ